MQWFLGDIIDSLFGMPGIIFTIMGGVGIVGIVFGSVNSIAVNRAREQTKREIAAYVAEGSIDPDKAIEMLKAGAKSDDE